jgi:hypothetical protein
MTKKCFANERNNPQPLEVLEATSVNENDQQELPSSSLDP